MRVLLDENLDWRLRREFGAEHDVVSVRYQGWGGKKNGELLRAAALEFDVLLTLDVGLEYEQNLALFDLAVIVIRAPSADVEAIKPALPKLLALLPSVEPGRAYAVTA